MPRGPFRLVTVNTAPERAKRLVGRTAKALEDRFTIDHVSNSIDEVESKVKQFRPDILFCASMWTQEEAAQIISIATSVNPELKTHVIPHGLQVEKGPDAIVEHLTEQIPILLQGPSPYHSYIDRIDLKLAMANDGHPTPSPSIPRSPPTANRHSGISGSRVRKPRAARACDACRAKKNKCNDAYPCAYCRKHGLECLYQGQDLGQKVHSTEYVKSLEEKAKRLSALEERLNRQEESIVDSASPLTRHVPPETQGNIGPEPAEPEDWASSPTGADGNLTREVSGINQHTRNVEFYGNSSAVALLSQVEHAGGEPAVSAESRNAGEFVSNLHNPAFSPSDEQSRCQSHETRCPPRFRSAHYSQCRILLLNYFSTIHYVHPILDKTLFLERCDKLNAEEEVGHGTEVSSFSALYYSVLSLGALVGPRDDEPIDGIKNISWSRAFFQEVVRRVSKLGMATDLNMVQCYFMMAKVCQNELNPHLAYMYIGLAVRTALAMGINREPRGSRCDAEHARAASRTWWGLYSLEVEMSFSMGRPDTLGADSYHNRRFPVIRDDKQSPAGPSGLLEHPYCAIIKSMVDLSRIIKTIGSDIYNCQAMSLRTVGLAFRLIEHLEQWVESLPLTIRPPKQPRDLMSLQYARDPQWARRQRLVLTLRYLNLRILTFGSFILAPTSEQRTALLSLSDAQAGMAISIEAAKHTIEIIYTMYQHSEYFRTWVRFYNTTYVSFAASILVVYALKDAREDEIASLLYALEQAIGLLETMDECVVAQKSAKLLQRATEKVKSKFATTVSQDNVEMADTDFAFQINHFWGWGPLNLLEGDANMDPMILFDQTEEGLNSFQFDSEMH
ncbi:transcriptional regulatory protein [Paramyrothecium foliicola]|nr:transcriptional regulatory protein [Paramyrothecium foliicola]